MVEAFDADGEITSEEKSRHSLTVVAARAALVGGRPIGAICLAGVLALPLFFSNNVTYDAGIVIIFFVGAVGLHVIVNWSGQLSLAQAPMVGLPAYGVLALSATYGISPIYLLPVAAVLGAVVSGAIGLPTLRAHGVQVALVTLVAGIALGEYFYNLTWLVGGAGGRVAANVNLGPMHLASSRALYPVLLVVTACAVVAAWVLMHSKVTRAWYGIKSDPNAAATYGVPVRLYRIGAFVAGGAFAGLAGGLTVMWVQALDQSAFPDTLSFSYLLVVVLAGNGFLGGLVYATWVLQGGQEFSDLIFGTNAGAVVTTLITYAGPLALIGMVVQYQAGLNGFGRSIKNRLVRAAAAGASAEESGAGIETLGVERQSTSIVVPASASSPIANTQATPSTNSGGNGSI